MPGRPPKPTKLLELSGALKKNPGRYKDRLKGEPKPKSGAFPPYPGSREGLTEEDAYNFIAAQAPEGVLTPSDVEYVMQVARLMFLSWNDACTASERHLLESMLGRLGMNPTARAKMNIAPPEKKKNKWADLDPMERIINDR